MNFPAGQTIRFRGKAAEARAEQAVKDAPGRVERVSKCSVRLLVSATLTLAAAPARRAAVLHPE